MSSLKREAEKSVQAVAALHTHHSRMTWNAGTPGIDPWLRDTLIALQDALNTVSATQVAIATSLDRTNAVVDQVTHYLDNQERRALRSE